MKNNFIRAMKTREDGTVHLVNKQLDLSFVGAETIRDLAPGVGLTI